MDGEPISGKVARLVRERGWNQEDFARIAGVNRHTVRLILLHPDRNLRNATVQACARALGLTVDELRERPLDELLPRMRGGPAVEDVPPTVAAWLAAHPGRLTADEARELTGDDLATVEQAAARIERTRRLVEQVKRVATRHAELLERLLEALDPDG